MRKASVLVALLLMNLILAVLWVRSGKGRAWERLFSPDLKQFVVNLRNAHCPEATVRDIATIEMKRRFAPRDAVLHDQPGDHLPLGWLETANRELQRRRREARLLAREKRDLLHDALGYDVPVELPAYALFAHDLKFEAHLATLPPEKRLAIRKIDDHYWVQAIALEERTSGFWEGQDVAELEQLKSERNRALEPLLTEAGRHE